MPIQTCALMLALTACPVAAFAQGGIHDCEATPEQIALYQNKLKPAGMNRAELLRAELARDPDDLFLNRWYLESPQIPLGSLREEYRKKLEAHPGEPRFLYFYGRALMGSDTPKAIEYLDQAKAKDPELVAAYLALMEIYASRNFKNSDKVVANMLAYSDRCPADLNGYTHIGAVEDKVAGKQLAARYRKAVEGRNTSGVASYYSRLWTAEFHAAEPAEFEALRTRVANDLKRVKELNPDNTQAQIEGYRLIGDTAAVKILEAKARPAGPQMRFNDAFTAWDKEHPWPKPDAPQSVKDKYFEDRMHASEQWVKDYAGETHAWYWRMVSLSAVKSTPAAEIEKAGEKVLAMDPHGWTMVPYSYLVAMEWVQHDIRLKDCLALARQAMAELEDYTAKDPDSANDMRRGANTGAANRMADGFTFTRFNIWTVEVDAARKLQDLAAMGAAVGEMKAWIDQHPGTDQYRRAQYLRAAARLAEEEGHSLDALTYYQEAVRLANPGDTKERARALWTKLGGGAETFEMWARKPEEPKEARPKVAEQVSAWTAKDQPLPLNAPDVAGKTWTVADLKGKTTLINVWATWCGPCLAELPELQKLYEQAKQRKDVQVITIDIDANPGLIAPFLAENKYTFPVVMAKEMVDRMVPSLAIPMNWIVDTAGNLRLESVGFGKSAGDWPRRMLDKLGEPLSK